MNRRRLISFFCGLNQHLETFIPPKSRFLHVVLRHYGEVDEVVVGEVLHVV